MAINVLQAAKYVSSLSNWMYTNLELQKLLYISHMYFYGETHEPLIEGYFQAWGYGPVHPDLFSYLKEYGTRSVPKSAFNCIEDLNKLAYKEEVIVLDSMVKDFPYPSRKTLLSVTHRANGAWRRKYDPRNERIIISDSDVIQEYERSKKDLEKV